MDNTDYTYLSESYDQRCQQWQRKPTEGRSCTDKCCCVVMVLMVISMIGVAGFFGSQYKVLGEGTDKQYINKSDINVNWQSVAVGCIVSVVATFIYMALIKCFPKCMIYTMMVLTGALMLILGIALIAKGLVGPGIMLLIGLALYCILLCCFRSSIEIGVNLVRAATHFISDTPSVFVAPIFKVILSTALIVISGLILVILAAKAQAKNASQGNSLSILSIVWIFYISFFLLVLYYATVFTIATQCSFWYYKITNEGNGLCQAYWMLWRYHFGTIGLAAAVVVIVQMIRQGIQNARRNSGDNMVVACCLCFVSCCLMGLEGLLKVLNHNAIILMTITGESYFESAKSALGLLWQNFPLLNISDTMGGVLIFWGMFLCSTIGSLIGWSLIKNFTTDDPSHRSTMALLIIGSMFLTSLILSVLSQSISSVFVFYCVDRRFIERGMANNNNMPAELVEIFNAQTNPVGTQSAR